MTVPVWMAAVLAAIALITGLRLWRQTLLRGWKVSMRLTLLCLHMALALLFYLMLFPPSQQRAIPVLRVLTADASAPATPAARLILLPEALASLPGARYPDLATALRAHPGTAHLRVIGSGLSMRDLDAASTLTIDFEPVAPMRGLDQLHLPERLRAGALWQLHGHVQAIADARIEVLDPAGARVASARVDNAGHFRLTLSAPLPGRALFTLRVRDAADAVVEELSLPLLVEAAQKARVLLIEGGIGPENKYLKRWALDAGIDLHTQLSLRPGAHMLSQAPTLDAAALSQLDLVILDERAFGALDANSRERVLAAVDDGLGMLLRLTGPLSATQRQQLAKLGFEVREAEIPPGLKLQIAAAAIDSADPAADVPPIATPAPITLSRRTIEVVAYDALPLLKADTGEPLALWRARGSGRVALWWLSDSFKLVLAGDPLTHGSVWADAVSTLARARSAKRPRLTTAHVRVGERQSVCGLLTDAEVIDAFGARVRLLRDPAAQNCAAWWPQRGGWHRLEGAESVGSVESVEWFVRAANEAPGLAASARRQATLEQASAARAPATTALLQAPGLPWPWFGAWLALSALSWWWERRRAATESSTAED